MNPVEILAAVCVITGILLLRHIADILPSLAGCLLRWKECINLENSVKLSHDRNIFAAWLTVPFCLAISGSRLYNPSFLDGITGLAYSGCIFAVFACYLAARTIPFIVCRAPRGGEKMFNSARKMSWSFFCILATAVLISAGICSFSDISAEITKKVELYAIGAAYLISIFRKYQIFHNSCSFLTSILYLCGLEILPTAILILSAVFL